MTNPDLDSREFYDIQWVKAEISPAPNVLWPDEHSELTKKALTWTETQLKHELFQYEVFLRKSLKHLFGVAKTVSSRKQIVSFEEEVRVYKEYVESTLIDVRTIAETLMRPSFLEQYLAFFSESERERTLLRFNTDGPVKSVRKLRLQVANAIRNKSPEKSLQDLYFELTKEMRFFWPNMQTIELAFQAILQHSTFKI